ncbi:MAG TPA: VOC family protein [bacterium]|nr:VOC family protein [bacterium]
MKRVTGLGGVFLKCGDNKAMLEWYGRHLGLDTQDWGAVFRWREDGNTDEVGYTVWSPFPGDSDYFAPSEHKCMLNFRVDDLEALVAVLREEGVEIVGEIKQEPNGKFAWIVDPEGMKVELWEPVPSAEDPYL